MLSIVRSWLKPDDILYCAHTLLYWLPLLHFLRIIRCHLVSLCYAREELDFASTHSAIIALTPAAAEQARKMAPKTRVAHLGWGADLSFFPRLTYAPEWHLSCGKTHRDHRTLATASMLSAQSLRVISPSLPVGLNWSPNTITEIGGKSDDTVTYDILLRNYYARCTASLIILEEDPLEKTAVGITNLIEAMAMARPVIATRTGALPSELDIEKAECGLFVPPNDPAALAKALQHLSEHTDVARAMGENGRRLSEKHYNIGRYARDLEQMFRNL